MSTSYKGRGIFVEGFVQEIYSPLKSKFRAIQNISTFGYTADQDHHSA